MKRRIFAIVLSCLMVLSLLPIAALAEETECEHEYVETVLQAPTCEKEGVKKIACKYGCGLPATYEKIDAHPLDEGTVIKAATCGEAGLVKYHCTACDYTVEKVVAATGEHDYQEGVIGATCTEPAKAGSICAVCKTPEDEGALEYVNDSAALGHDWVLDKTAEDYVGAECLVGGVDTFKCSRCEETYSEDTEATGHNWDNGVVKNATCEYGKHVLNTCLDCGETKVSAIEGEELTEGLGHKWVDAGVVAPTCDKDGYTLQKCERCSATQEIDPVASSGHDLYTKVVAPTCSAKGYTLELCHECDYSEVVVGSEVAIDEDAHTPVKVDPPLKEATCNANGVAKSVCADCGKTLGYMAIEADHVWDKGVVVTPNTCDEDGEMLYTCTACKEATKTEVIPAGHDEKFVVLVAGNCGKDGKLGVTCSRCDFTEERVIAATGNHTFVEKVVAATCTSPAMAGTACAVCDTPDGELIAVEGSKPLGHDCKDTYVPATCLEKDGVKTTCSRCDYATYEEIGYNEALGHDWVKGDTVAPTCTDKGYTAYACSRCDATEERDVKPAFDHMKDGESAYKAEVVKPTCVEGGYTNMVCELCGDSYVLDGSETEADTVNGHKKVKVGVLQPATCTTQGVAKMACKYCEIGMGYEAIPASHTWDKGTVTTPATCTEPGVRTFACSVCGVNPTDDEILAAELDTVVPASHKMDKGTVTTKATCGKDGVKTFACANCDYTETEAIAATGKHTYEEKIIAATCDDVAYVASQCSVCGDVKSKTAVDGSVALGHNIIETVVSAGCTNAQYVQKVCDRCGFEDEPENTNIPGTGALGHDWDDGVVFDPECGVEGYTLFTCKRCGETEERDPVEALEHDYVATTTPATCAKEGKIEMICSICDAIDEDAEVEILPIDEDNHTPVQASVLQQPTCDAYGVAKMVCKDCGAGCGYQAIDPEHKYDDGKITTPATCVKDGVKTFTCSACGDSYTEAVLAAHKYNDGVVTTPATCGKNGEITYTCTVCVAGTEGHSYTEEILATGEHTFAETIIGATCDSPAMAGIACTVCGTPDPEIGMTVVTGSVALGHDTVDVLIPADCTNGQRVQTTCTRCDYKLVEETGLEDALGHSFVRFFTGAANGKHRGLCSECGIITEDCTVSETEIIPGNCQNGTRVVGDCDVCGKTTVVDDDGVKIPTEHNYGIEKVLVPATCDSDGISKFTCECDKDGKIYIYRVTTKEHTWGEDKVNEDATAVYHVCSVCGTEEILQIFPGYVCKDHPADYVEVFAGVEADCDNTGLTAGKYCHFCNNWIVKQIVIPVKHNYVYLEDALNSDFEYVLVYQCTECGDKIEVIQ